MGGWGGGAGASFRLICLLFQRHANGSGLADVAGGAPIRELVGNVGGDILGHCSAVDSRRERGWTLKAL